MIMSFKIVGTTTVHQEEIKLSVERRVIKKKKSNGNVAATKENNQS